MGCVHGQSASFPLNHVKNTNELISNTLKVRNMYRKIKNKFWTVYLFISNFDDQINDV